MNKPWMNDIKIYAKEQQGYPFRLHFLADAPEVLYVRGRLPSDSIPSLAIVGARDCSHYGSNIASEYAAFFARAGIQIISGLARGIDAAAHRGALSQKGQTFGVLGCGVEQCYPASNRNLYDQMVKEGGVLSEFEEGERPLAWHFPRRNRVISGLADAVLVVEARVKSGSLITADLALEQGKPVFAIPGRVGDLLSEGCNQLIYQGAVPAWKPEVILQEMKWEPQNGSKAARESALSGQIPGLGLAREEELVYSCLGLNPKSVIQIQEETGLSIANLMVSLTHLVMAGAAKEVWKHQYIREGSRIPSVMK